MRDFKIKQVVAAACLVWLTTGGMAHAQQGNEGAGSVYTCIDADGRRITSDRPIPQCLNRTQHELGRSGTTRRTIEPALTASESRAVAEREKQAALERQRLQRSEQRDRALLVRYPDAATHEAGRQRELAQTQVVIDAAEQRVAELQRKGDHLRDELTFYQDDPSKTPVALRENVKFNHRAIAEQQAVIGGQRQVQDRINQRFDEESARLSALRADR